MWQDEVAKAIHSQGIHKASGPQGGALRPESLPGPDLALRRVGAERGLRAEQAVAIGGDGADSYRRQRVRSTVSRYGQAQASDTQRPGE